MHPKDDAKCTFILHYLVAHDAVGVIAGKT